VAAVTRIGFDAMDLLWRNARVAGRADIVRLSRQLHRNEDKLERVLQEVEGLRDDVTRDRQDGKRDLPNELTRGQSEQTRERNEQETRS
jgi:hypothetical protein